MKALRALILVFTLSVCASAGNMPNGVTGNMGNGVSGNMANDVAGNMPTGVAGNMACDVAGEMPNGATDPITEMALSILHSVLSLL